MLKTTKPISLFIFIFLNIALFGIIAGCSCNGGDPITDQMPEILDADAPFYITEGTPISYPFYASVSDPQGFGDIDKVYITIERPDGSFNPDTLFMHDNGLNIDTTENDGVYSYALDEDELTIFDVNGSHLFHFHANDQDGNLAAAVRKMATVLVQPSPVLISLTAPAILPLGFPDTISIYVIADDLQGIDDIASVYFTIKKPDNTFLPDTSFMLDDGQGCDSIADDGIFSYCLTGIDTSELGGDYIYYFTARDNSGNPGNIIEHTISMSDVNPYVYNLVAPDSIIRNYDDSSYFYISVWDPQGLNNIDQVYYVVTRPDGTSNGTGFLMTDRGDHGDSVAGDGRYATGFTGPTPQNQAGDYIFSFTAIDDQENQANVINHIITAYDTTSLMNYKHRNNINVNDYKFKQPDTIVEVNDFLIWQ